MPSTSAPRSRNPRGSGPQLRASIVAAGLRLVDETGDPASLTLRGIAREAGISAPSIYPHFADLGEVIDAILAASFDELLASVRESLDAQANPVDALLAAARAYVVFGWDHRARYGMMFAASGFAPDAVATFALVEQVIAQCVAADLSSSADPRGDAFLVWVGMHGMATLEKPDRESLRRLGPLDRPRLLEQMVRSLAKIR